eukprot:448287_1
MSLSSRHHTSPTHTIFVVCLFVLYNYCLSDEYALPSTIIPINYDITLFPHLSPDTNGNFSFNGWETIELNITINHLLNYPNNSLLFIQLNKGININITSNIPLNISDLQLYFPNCIMTSFNTITEIITFTYNITNNELLTLITQNNILYGITVYISLEWNSPLTNRYGLYLSPYIYNNITLYGVGTQMQPIYARWVIPIYDEPKYRSTYDITFIAPIHSITLSNMEIINIINLTNTNEYECEWLSYTGNGTNYLCKIIQFKTTPIMPSYLLAFVIGDYDYLQTKVLNYTQTLYFELNKSNEYIIALNTSKTIMPWFEKTLNISYPLSKLDDASFQGGGAMENWGLIIYCSKCIATTDSYTSNNQRPLVGLMAHEYAHQWFGNLVTINSWSHTWLNEGFARYLEYVSGNDTRPDLPFWETWYGYGPWPTRLDNDISIFTPPIIKQNISTQNDIRSMFSSTTYDKGAAINKMLAYYMGKNAYFNGINEYLNTYKYKSIETDNLLDILIKYDTRLPSSHTIKTMMDSWLYQSGYPVLYVNIDEIDNNNLLVTLNQKRNIKEGPQFFYSDRGNDILGHDIYPYYDSNLYNISIYQNTIWNIPIYIKNIENVTHFVGIFNKTEMTFEIIRDINNFQEFYYFNPEYCNFYRIVYSKNAFEWLYKNLNKLEQWEAYSLLFDSLQLVQSGYISPVNYLEMIAFVIQPNIITTQNIFYFWDRLYDGLIAGSHF